MTPRLFRCLALLLILTWTYALAERAWPKAHPKTEVVTEGTGSDASEAGAVRFTLALVGAEKDYSEDVVFVFDESPALHRLRGLTPILKTMKKGEIRRFFMTRYSLAGYTQSPTYYEKPYEFQLELKEIFPLKEVQIFPIAPGDGERIARRWDTVKLLVRPLDDITKAKVLEVTLAPEKTSVGMIECVLGMSKTGRREVEIPYYLAQGLPGFEELTPSQSVGLRLELMEFVDPL